MPPTRYVPRPTPDQSDPLFFYKLMTVVIEDQNRDRMRDEIFDQMVVNFTEECGPAINNALIDALPENVLNIFEYLMQTEAELKAVDEFFHQHVPQREQIALNTMMEFRRLYVDDRDWNERLTARGFRM